MGMNACKLVARNTTLDQRKSWVGKGICSDLMLIEPWSELPEYPPQYSMVPARFAEIHILTEPKKEAGYKTSIIWDLKDVISMALHRPGDYLKGYLAAWFCYFRATDESIFLPFQQKLRELIASYDYLIYGKSSWSVPYKTSRKEGHKRLHISYFWIAAAICARDEALL